MSPSLVENPASVASVFAALGDRTRLSLLSRLCDGRSLSITELTQDTGVTRQGISKHLKVLEDSGVVSRERVGRESRYVIRADSLVEAKRYLERASRQWDDAIVRLQKLVDD
ncbi:helix-turn-helix transcriptional regulator [Rhizobium leguminosarum]|nr:metalloregulator ArsR/SmtB family transcription factor [Rhizobium leguminosarum]MBY5841128.1 helix-turn-helix transcriptional regulator [Rhizobium leguminosarum]NKM81659.1 metalloregulator ArsR/SmtB family transcription factor [Rhizobium leguminosarum bv. viciae]QSZ08780.1 helix-turn-helix transcriptional regulator [Rhizobium leguminosarum]